MVYWLVNSTWEVLPFGFGGKYYYYRETRSNGITFDFNEVSRDEPSSVAYNKVSYNPKDYYCDKTSTIGQMTIPDS